MRSGGEGILNTSIPPPPMLGASQVGAMHVQSIRGARRLHTKVGVHPGISGEMRSSDEGGTADTALKSRTSLCWNDPVSRRTMIAIWEGADLIGERTMKGATTPSSLAARGAGAAAAVASLRQWSQRRVRALSGPRISPRYKIPKLPDEPKVGLVPLAPRLTALRSRCLHAIRISAY